MSASASSSVITPSGFVAKDFLARAQASLKLTPSQLSTLSELYADALKEEALESHCQHFIKSKKAPCGRELKDGKCPTHGDDIFAPIAVPGAPIVAAKCPFVKKDGAICERNCAKGKNVCPLHIGKTMSSDMISCNFVIQSGERKGSLCDKKFGERVINDLVPGYIPNYEEICRYCPTHYDAEIKRRIKEKKEKPMKEKKEKPMKEKKEKKSEVEMKEEVNPLDSDFEEDDAIFGEDEIDLSQPSKAAKSYPKFDFALSEEISAAAIKVDGSDSRYLRMKSKAQLYPIIFDRTVYEKENGVLEIIGYTTDLQNKVISQDDFKQEWHPLMDEVIPFYNSREYKIRINASLHQ